MPDDHTHYPPDDVASAMLVASMHLQQGEFGCATMEVSLCPDGNHVLVNSEDTDGDVTSIDMPAAQALYVSAAMRLAALRVIAKTAAAADLPNIAAQIEDCQRAIDELMETGPGE